jgi:hypothetical protein
MHNVIETLRAICNIDKPRYQPLGRGNVNAHKPARGEPAEGTLNCGSWIMQVLEYRAEADEVERAPVVLGLLDAG